MDVMPACMRKPKSAALLNLSWMTLLKFGYERADRNSGPHVSKVTHAEASRNNAMSAAPEHRQLHAQDLLWAKLRYAGALARPKRAGTGSAYPAVVDLAEDRLIEETSTCVEMG